MISLNMAELIDRENPQKLYMQLIELIKKKIDSKEWAVGGQIPVEEGLCRIYGVSKATVRTAILELVKQGYLMRQQGRGTFVSKRVISEGLTMLTSFKELMLEAGVKFSTSVLVQTVIMPVDDLDINLNIPEDRHVIYIKRLRMVEDEPVLLEEAYIPHHICPELLGDDIEHNSLLELIEKKHGIKITKVKGYVEIAYTTQEEGRMLGLGAGQAVLLFSQYFYSGDTQIMYIRAVKRPDRFKFFIELDRRAA